MRLRGGRAQVSTLNIDITRLASIYVDEVHIPDGSVISDDDIPGCRCGHTDPGGDPGYGNAIVTYGRSIEFRDAPEGLDPKKWGSGDQKNLRRYRPGDIIFFRNPKKGEPIGWVVRAPSSKIMDDGAETNVINNGHFRWAPSGIVAVLEAGTKGPGVVTPKAPADLYKFIVGDNLELTKGAATKTRVVMVVDIVSGTLELNYALDAGDWEARFVAPETKPLWTLE